MTDAWIKLTPENVHAVLTAQSTVALADFAADLDRDERFSPEQRERAMTLARAVAEREQRAILLAVADTAESTH